jgi:hypothetical protein
MRVVALRTRAVDLEDLDLDLALSLISDPDLQPDSDLACFLTFETYYAFNMTFICPLLIYEL